ncbi:hypothetical protein QZH41_003833 [Actinostola sp. cb2023]|nr:hypothetical protein QZH41_003833 [Actinostola sp. cb2023]
MAEFVPLDGSSSPGEWANFLEFADSLNIPVNQECIQQIRLQHGVGSELGSTFLDVGVKDSKGHTNFSERRLQNAIWRAWWRQRRARFNTGPRILPLQDEDLLLRGMMANGKDIGDIPTEYRIPKLFEHELPVIGTYVDPNVLPGFRYRVRVCDNGDDEYLFEGKSLRLDRVGPGYGKRLTFEDQDILCNENFFWSDSNPDGGFAFSIQCLSEGERFGLFDCDSRLTGEVVIAQVDPKQHVLTAEVTDSGTTLRVGVSFECKLTLHGESAEQESVDESTISVSGTALVVKPLKSKFHTVTEITGENIPGIKHCILRKLL